MTLAFILINISYLLTTNYQLLSTQSESILNVIRIVFIR